ncbi:MAG TPA: TspO/MBR family protein [Rhizomicrobium sp.]|nr:TspO/MBR family protein [Rhizomicrobium sp.]
MFFDRSAEPGQHRPLLAFLIATLLVGAAGTLFTEPAIPTWYAGLAKPAFTPPNWLFAPVWTTLYVLMGVAAWRVWRLTGLNSPELILWMSQLTLNVLWSALFFSAHLILLALVEMALLWLLILVTMILFWQRDRIAGLLFVPYLAWVSFAFALNFAIWQLNGA